MGFLNALAIRDSELSLEQQIAWHLQYNCYPPVTTNLVEPCINALNELENNNENELIDLPEGIYWKNQSTAPAIELIKTFRLEAWLVDVNDDL